LKLLIGHERTLWCVEFGSPRDLLGDIGEGITARQFGLRTRRGIMGLPDSDSASVLYYAPARVRTSQKAMEKNGKLLERQEIEMNTAQLEEVSSDVSGTCSQRPAKPLYVRNARRLFTSWSGGHDIGRPVRKRASSSQV